MFSLSIPGMPSLLCAFAFEPCYAPDVVENSQACNDSDESLGEGESRLQSGLNLYCLLAQTIRNDTVYVYNDSMRSPVKFS